MNNVKISVACIVHDSKDAILLVKERQVIGVVYNQPAGHLRPGETLIQGAVREVKDRCGVTVEIKSMLGIYEHYFEETGSHVIRFCFIAEAPKRVSLSINLHKEEIVSAEFYSKEQLKEIESKYRNPLVKMCVEDFYKGRKYSLDCLEFV